MSNINSKSVTLIRKVSKSFNLLIQGFSISDTFLFLCKIPALKITASFKMAYKFVSTISLGRNRITISKFAMNQKENVSIAIRSTDSFLTKLSEKWQSSQLGNNGYIQIPLYITAATKSIERWMNNTISQDRIKLGQNAIVFTMTIASFTKLSTLDSQTLSALDVQTINALDYVVT